MGYPDTFEGFVIDSQSEWTNFRKADVCLDHPLPHQCVLTLKTAYT